MKYFMSLVLVLAALCIGGCDFLGSDKGDGEGNGGGGGPDQTLVVEE